MDFMKSIKLLILFSDNVKMGSRNNPILGGKQNRAKQDKAKPVSGLHRKNILSEPSHEN